MYTVRPEAFAFHLWGLYQAGVRGKALHTSDFGRLLWLDGDGARRTRAHVAEKGWWRFAAIGAHSRLKPGTSLANSVLLPGSDAAGRIHGSILWEGWSTLLS